MRAEYESSDPPYTGAIYLPSSSSSEESGGELEDPSSSEGEESLSEESRAARAGGFITSGALFDLFDGALFGSAAASGSSRTGSLGDGQMLGPQRLLRVARRHFRQAVIVTRRS